MARKQKPRRKERGKYTDAQLQAFRARQESTLSREELEQRREAEREREREIPSEQRRERPRKRQEDTPLLTPEQIAAEYSSVRQELNRIAIFGGMMLLLLAAIAVYMNL